MATQHFGDFELMDYSEKRASTRFYFGGLTALNLAGFLTQFGNLRNALDAITLGTITKERWIGDRTLLSNTLPTDHRAQVEMVWKVYWDNTDGGGRNQRVFYVPTPDPDKLIPGTDRADFADPDIAAFITAFQALVIDPVDPEAPATISRIIIGGRDR